MSRKYPRPSPPQVVVTNGEDPFRSAPTEDPMIIKFTSVTLHKAMPRLDSGKGQATQETTFFDVVRALVTVELDTASQLVRIAKGNAVAYVPLAGVERFGPTVEDAARFATARAADAAKAAADATA